VAHTSPDQLSGQLQESLGDGYNLERELGGGGMARVFVAYDHSLGRRIVVKVLPLDAAGSSAGDRFQREIKLAARLQHPHIVPLIAAHVTQTGVPYYTMPFVTGESLRARLKALPAGASLPRSEARRVLRDVASALAYAHREGVVHRDIKPENVLLHDDSAVVTDFGIAKARAVLQGASAADAATLKGTLTAAGTALGTPAYMAPEQALGDAIDHRADLYAWGMMAYEVLSGSHPFADRTTAQQLVAAQVTEMPRPLADREAARDIDPDLSAIVMRCIAKNAADRPGSAAELVDALEKTVTGAAEHAPRHAAAGEPRERSTARMRTLIGAGALGVVAIAVSIAAVRRWLAPAVVARSVAVLAFENTAHDTAADYLVEGIGDELRSRLTGIPGLSVKGRASSSQFVGHVDPRDVGKKLGVTAVITGVARRSEDQVHIVAELDDAVSGNALWSRNYDGAVQTFASLRDSMAAQVITALAIGAGRVTTHSASDAGTNDFEALNEFLLGQHAFSRLDFARAASHYAGAVRRDSAFTRAWASLTIALASEPRNGLTPTDSASVAATAALARTLTLDPNAPLARVAEAAVLTGNFQLRQAAPILAAVVAKNPDDVLALEQYVLVLGNLGRIHDAADIVDRVRRIDPLSPFVNLGREFTLTLLHRFRDAVDIGGRDLENNPLAFLTLRNMSAAYVFLGMPDSAVATMETAWRSDSSTLGARTTLAFAYAAAGRWKDVDRLEGMGAAMPPSNSPDFDAAAFDIMNGRNDSAMRHVERGVATKQPMFITAWLACDPEFDILKGTPRFAALMTSMGAQMCAPVEHWPIPARPRR
jgi:eukaryotic-like serine/threonine-protein kinase